MSFKITVKVIGPGSVSPGTCNITKSGGTFTFTPHSGCAVSNVKVDKSNLGAIGSYTFSNVTKAHTLTVTFAQGYTITASVTGVGGTIMPSGGVPVYNGGDCLFRFIPTLFDGTNAYVIQDVLVDGVSVGDVTNYMFLNIQGPHTISCSFTTASVITVDCRSTPMNRSKWTNSIGIDVDSMDVELYPQPGTDLLSGTTWQAAIAGGVFDTYIFQLYRIFYTDFASGGGFLLMSGKAGDIEVDRQLVKITINSFADLFSSQLPRNVYGTSCYFNLFGPGCLVNRATYTQTGTIESASRTNADISISEDDNYYNYGVITFTSGALTGFSYSIQNQVGTTIYPLLPFVTTPAVGDNFTITPGCDGSYTGGCAKFGNQSRFPGMLYIPLPTTTAPQAMTNSCGGSSGKM